MGTNKTQQKWNTIYQDANIGDLTPPLVLSENAFLLAGGGTAFDLASGLGGSAIYLARHGFTVTAWDISDVAMQKLAAYARHHRLAIQAETHDMSLDKPLPNSFDVIVGCHYLDRSLMPVLMHALKPGGLIFYQTFLQETTDDSRGPSDMNYRLANNELLALFNGLRIIVYRENGLLGDLTQGLRNEAMIVAQKND